MKHIMHLQIILQNLLNKYYKINKYIKFIYQLLYMNNKINIIIILKQPEIKYNILMKIILKYINIV